MGWQNFFATRLFTDIGASDTTITLEQVPLDTSGRLVIEARNPSKREIIEYSGISGNDLTGVTRGIGGTNATTHSQNSLVEMNVVAEDLEDALNVPNVIAVEHYPTGEHKDVTADSLVVAGKTSSGSFNDLAGGWVLGELPTPNTITNNGNRSYDLVFNGTDLTDTVSEGMRLRTTRTVSAPTQCADLNGTNQYFNDTTVAGTTFTDDFCAGAWVKMEAYGANTVVSRYNGTSGWEFIVLATGQVRITGYNAGAGNFSTCTSFQSIPLGKWVHIAGQLDMSAFTATTTTSYIMIDGVNVPAQVTRGGTNPTALVQAGNLEVGSENGTNFFNGKLAQVFYSSAKITQANVQTLISQGLTPALISANSIVSAYSLSNDITDLNTTTANNLTAQGSALATNVDSPFGSYLGGTLDYGIITKTAFSTNTTLTVQVPEGCTIPTSGGVSAVAYSTQAVPYGFSGTIGSICSAKSVIISTSTTASTSYGNLADGVTQSVTVPIINRRARVTISFVSHNSAAEIRTSGSFAVSGATTISAFDNLGNDAANRETTTGSGGTNGISTIVDLNNGMNTFTLQFKTQANTSTILARTIEVEPL
jgi:hypothetical protein